MADFSVEDVNPNQAFKITPAISGEISTAALPNRYIESSERPLEPYSLFWGDMITFEDPEKVPNPTHCVVTDVGKDTAFMVSRLLQDEAGNYLMSPTSFSTQGVEQIFYRLGERWNQADMKQAISRYFENEYLTIENSHRTPEEKTRYTQIYHRMEEKLLQNIDSLGTVDSRQVTADNIRTGRDQAQKLRGL